MCSEHFTNGSFKSLSVVSGKLGMRMKQMLKPDTVPTIFPKPTDIPKANRIFGAHEKRERARVKY